MFETFFKKDICFWKPWEKIISWQILKNVFFLYWNHFMEKLSEDSKDSIAKAVTCSKIALFCQPKKQVQGTVLYTSM